MKRDWTCGVRSVALAGLLVGSGLSSPRLAAQVSNVSAPANVAAGNPITTLLNYTEVPYSVVSWGISVQSQAAPFAKEPELSGRQVKRGRLDFRSGRGQAVGFIWDAEQSKLHLDINDNGDLTDDTNGVFASETKSTDKRFQAFKDIRLTCPTGTGLYPLLLDLNVNQYSTLYVSASLRSFYAGKVTLADREWQVGIVEQPYAEAGSLQNTSLLLRPWDSQAQPFRTGDGRLEAFTLPKTLFFSGRSYGVRCAWDAQNEPRRCRLELTETTALLGDLKVAGELIRRALLKDANQTVVLDAPTGTVRVPAGAYTSFQVHLQKGERSASLKSDFYNRGVQKTLTVQADKPGTLLAGGPLTNTVTVLRRGNLLELQHSIIGAGQEAYSLDGATDHQHPPTFAIYLGEKEIATGKFEFG